MAAERLHLEKALKISEERYRILAEMTSDYANVYRFDRNGQAVLEWERDNALTQMTGYTRPEIEANGGPGFLVLPEDRENAQPYWPPNNRIQESQFRLRHKNGEIHWVQRITLWDASNEGDVLGRYYETLKDITESKKMEAQALSLSLEQERTRILRNFIRDASHEFRTPLSIIEFNLYAIRRSCEKQEHHQRFDVVSSQIRIMSELVDNLLLLSQLDHDTALKFSTLHVNTLVAAECELLRPLADKKSLALHIDLGAKLPSILGNSYYLMMTIRHLLHNAIRYTEQGYVRIATHIDADHVVIEVCDSGIGMSDEVQQHIFERFYRYNDAHSDSGFGLGLSIVQKVVEHHRGHIIVESAPEQGSIFRIYLPT
jgi:PAS domain S-box-containing protein